MSESSQFGIGDGTPEAVAYRLMLDVMRVENRTMSSGALAGAHTPADRHYLLNTYHECLMAVRGKRIAASTGNNRSAAAA